ncbi:MAG: (2Fe-2S)-binding protein [Pseudomonadota bacterium]
MTVTPRAKRLSETDREVVTLHIDGIATRALAGDTLLTAILLSRGRTGTDAFNKTTQAGFCLMGACQSCWVWTTDGQRLRACDTPVQESLKIFTNGERAEW